MRSEYLPVKKPSCISKDRKERKLANALRSYITVGNECYDADFAAEILSIQPQWAPRPTKYDVSGNMQKLLEMAKNGHKRPHCASKQLDMRRLGGVLNNYIHNHRHPEFVATLRSLRPDWFRDEKIRLNKQKLLEIAKSGAKKPSKVSDDREIRLLSAVLYNYLDNDPVFAAKIRKLRPDWFESIADKNKQELLRIAESGGQKPDRLRHVFYSYTQKSSESYDLKFDEKIRRIRPDWFSSVDACKRELIRLAQCGAKKPIHCRSTGCTLGKKLAHYMRSDPKFNKIIRALRPDWFVKSSTLFKQKLLEIAKRGCKRPNGGSSSAVERQLGNALCHYTNRKSKSYDPDFDAMIRRLRPDWFETSTIDGQKVSAIANKQKLLNMAKSGGDKPRTTSKNIDEKRLGGVLSTYISKKCKSYDPAFDRLIHKLRPDWFYAVAAKKSKLLAMAKCGKKRPNSRSNDSNERCLGGALISYTCSHSDNYDQEFDKEIRELCPDWFRLRRKS